jgi:serine protease Do
MKSKLPLICLYAVIITLLYVMEKFEDLEIEVRRPTPRDIKQPAAKIERHTEPASVSGTPLEDPSPVDPIFTRVPGGLRRDSAGTAFSIRKFGWFMTARHVVDDCDRVGIVNDDRRIVTVSDVILSASADIALLKSTYSPVPLPVEQVKLRYGQSGFSYGYPHAKWAQVHSLLLGRARFPRADGGGLPEPMLVWSTSNIPASGLGGMSGGPMLDAMGIVVGVHSSSWPRRGRLYTVAPISMNALLTDNNLTEDQLPGLGYELEGLNENRYVRVGERLRVRGRVALVLCDVTEHDAIKGWR